ncbi:beta-lactamase family protein [Actinoplanes bogorensis]|uniref:Beta-lactamase family protein n=1 Tax=Paractinoplanes bogorensis TaxID=1610840 RepID=A0ABS5YL12_9ACTN|nr:serine hydrolase domain-containing protein [Actinoplanes bogorensis]MBU2663726.1 beta-lactamase family protein [Actinoplanes bogorensis]
MKAFAVALAGLLGLGAHPVVAGTSLAALADREVRSGAPGVVIRIDNGSGRTIEVARQASWTRADHRLSVDDQFRMASNTKVMVATLVMQLVAERRVRLDDPVARWLPGALADGRRITVRMLLNHTSGLPDYLVDVEEARFDTEVLRAVTGEQPRDYTPQQLLDIAARYPAKGAPGERFSYSDTNYIALGMILEQATGKSLPVLLRDRIVRPLGLRDTYFATDGRSRDGNRLARGYEPDGAHLAPLLEQFGAPAGTAFAGPTRHEHTDVTGLSPSWAWAAGAVVSTPRDFTRFLSALFSGRLLPAAQLAQMRVTVEDPAGDGSMRYGLGVMEYTNSCGTVWGHTGGIPGYGSQNYTDSTGRRTMTVVSTTQFGAKFPEVAVADQAVVDAAVCVMLDRPIPAT